MIISASYKTDIPAFYGEWFKNRLRAGYCRMANPYNHNQTSFVSLEKNDVDGFVFWTKNLAPFSDALAEVHRLGFPFVVQYTINGYSREVESRVIDYEISMRNFRAAAEKYGPDSLVWRYDPIIMTSEMDAAFHRSNFARIASNLSRYTTEVVVSFLQVYSKTKGNLDRVAKEYSFEWQDPSADTKRAILGDLVEIAAQRDLKLSICTQPEFKVTGVHEARCIDAGRMMRVSGGEFRSRIKGMRPNCGCFESKDIGDYDTCPHGCVYCYAVRRRDVALRRYRSHDPQSEFLFTPRSVPAVNSRETGTSYGQQLPLPPA